MSRRINNEWQHDKEKKDQQLQAVGKGAEGSTMTGSRTKSRRIISERQQDKEHKDQQ
jgi:hypothetical protein